MSRDLDYERDNVGYDEQYPDGDGIKCKNHIVCGAVLPSWWYSCKEHYLCTTCDVMFGTWSSGSHVNTGKGELSILNDIECPICFETGTGVMQSRCDHCICVKCFKRCYFGSDEKPEFPYTKDIEDYYNETDECSEEWYSKYPLVKDYEDKVEQGFINGDNLQRCCICRK